jgi:hypothetical protein
MWKSGFDFEAWIFTAGVHRLALKNRCLLLQVFFSLSISNLVATLAFTFWPLRASRAHKLCHLKNFIRLGVAVLMHVQNVKNKISSGQEEQLAASSRERKKRTPSRNT